MVDAERLHRILRRITDDLARLRPYADADVSALLADDVRLGHLKYLCITAIEGCVDAAQHVCATEGFGPPHNNGDAMRLLGRHRVIEPALAEELAHAVAFRNLLVHGYATVDDRRVVDNLRQLDDIEAYVEALTRLVGHADQ